MLIACLHQAQADSICIFRTCSTLITCSSQDEDAYNPTRERPRLEPSPVHQHPVLVLDGVGTQVTGKLE